jgi:inner membrane protein
MVQSHFIAGVTVSGKLTDLMDQLTHSATGLFLSRAGLDRFTPHAGMILILAANIPDIDVVAALGGTLSYLTYHRHLTHSLAMLPLLALIPVLIVRAFRPLRWKGAYGISLAGVASHLLLDWTNIYGIRLLLPFSAEWFHLDITSVIDLWIWAVILLALAAPVVGRLVTSEIGARPGRTEGRGFAIAALAFLAIYNGAHGLGHASAIAMLDARVYHGSAPLRVAAFPDPANPWRFRGLVETREFYGVQDINLLADFDPNASRILYKPEPNPAIEAAAQTATFRHFLGFAQYPLWRVLPAAEPENAVTVEAMDLRFGDPSSPGFVATAILDSRLRVIREWFTFGAAKPR